MSKEGIIEEVVSPLLKQLASARRLAAKKHASSEINRLFDEIKTDVGDMKEKFHKVEKWEGNVINDFGLIAREVDDISEEGCSLPTLESKLQTIHREISKLRDSVTPEHHLPLIESGTTSSSVSLSPSPRPEALQALDEWRRLEMEKRFLENPTMSNLQISYDNLDLQLKLCLLCFSIFPENSIIKKRPLIYWWIGEGLVTPSRGMVAWDIGDRCFRELIAKGLIEPISRKRSPVIDCCKIHPWTRRMLISVAKSAELFDFDSEGNPTSNFSTTHRACLVTGDGRSSQLMDVRNPPSIPEELLTLFNVNEKYLKFDKSWFSQMKNIAVLQLGRWETSAKHHIEVDSTEFLEGLSSFNKLKYLSFQGISRITELPASIGKINNLRILDLRACHNLERLTVGITYLKKLTHLDVSECYLLEHMPKGMSSLSELQVVKGFVIGDSRSKDPCRLSELANLKKLRKLSINIGSKAVIKEGELDLQRGFEALRSLTITWGVVIPPPSKEGTAPLTRADTMTGTARLKRAATMTTKSTTSLSLPRNLKKLDLRCFPGEKEPDWLSSTSSSLEKLYIRGGLLASLDLGSDTNGWIHLEVLRLKFLKKLEVKWDQLQAQFPKLAYLEILDCNKELNLSSFPCDEDGVWVKDKRERADPRSRRNNNTT